MKLLSNNTRMWYAGGIDVADIGVSGKIDLIGRGVTGKVLNLVWIEVMLRTQVNVRVVKNPVLFQLELERDK